jgi:REP-associated tyrosine transposase
VKAEHRDESPGFHHVVTRGNNKRDIFVDDADRDVFCQTVERVARRNEWTILAYCLMKNHYHLIISVGDKGLARGMCELNTAYACTFNARHGRINHLFGKRYWNRRICTDASLLNAIRYVVQNPRSAGGSRPLEAYAWSSYAATIGLAQAKIALARDELLPFFASTPARAVEEFRIYCSASGLARHVPRQPP